MSDVIVVKIDEVDIAESAAITFNRKGNPKREGSKAYLRYQNYMDAETVGEYLENDGTKADLRYDWEKGFIEIEGIERPSKK